MLNELNTIFPLLHRYTLGGSNFVEHMFDDISGFRARAGAGDSYPPYNIQDLGNNQHRVEIALAGFDPKNIVVSVEKGILTVSATAEETESNDAEYNWRGIARRAFTRQFRLMDYGEVVNATYKNGLLIINTCQRLPEAMKSKTIKIEHEDSAELFNNVNKGLSNDSTDCNKKSV